MIFRRQYCSRWSVISIPRALVSTFMLALPPGINLGSSARACRWRAGGSPGRAGRDPPLTRWPRTGLIGVASLGGELLSGARGDRRRERFEVLDAFAAVALSLLQPAADRLEQPVGSEVDRLVHVGTDLANDDRREPGRTEVDPASLVAAALLLTEFVGQLDLHARGAVVHQPDRAIVDPRLAVRLERLGEVQVTTLHDELHYLLLRSRPRRRAAWVLLTGGACHSALPCSSSFFSSSSSLSRSACTSRWRLGRPTTDFIARERPASKARCHSSSVWREAFTNSRAWRTPSASRRRTRATACSASARMARTRGLSSSAMKETILSPPWRTISRRTKSGVRLARFSSSKTIWASVTEVRSSLVRLSMIRTSSPLRTISAISARVT